MTQGTIHEPVGTLNVVDHNPLNWLFITWNTMEEPVRTDQKGSLANSIMESSEWLDDRTLKVNLRHGVVYQNGEKMTAAHFVRAFEEVQKWKAPHPPGTYLNFHPDTTLEVPDDHTVIMSFPEPDGLVLAKFRGFHIPTIEFWDNEGFGPRAIGSAEGHW